MILLGGAAAGGALIVGYAMWPSDRLERVAKLAGGKDEQVITNWLMIGADDSVTVIVPHCDMGTGIFTALPQIAAEELDADWSKVRAEQAPADPVFANGALAEGFILTGQDMTRKSIPAFLRGVVDNSFRTIAAYKDLQITGGSSAVRFTGVYGMRITAAAAREMLVKAAAARWKVSPDSCTVKNSRVIHGGKSFGFGELAAEAAKYSPSDTPKVKSPSDYTLIGKPLARADIPPKTNGTAQYGLDVKLDGMHYAALRIVPVFGGKLSSVDTDAVEKKRGIKKIVKLDDAVIVVADRFWRARDGALALQPKWDDGGNGRLDSAALTAKRAAALKAGKFENDIKTGDGAGALKTGGVVEAAYSVPYLAHATMEPMNATALFKDGKLEVWSGTQDGLGARAHCAKVADLDLDQVSFNLMHLGGGFGRRLPGYFNFLTYAVKTAMAIPGVPVKLIFTREDDMHHDYYRPNVLSQFKAALSKDGMPVAWVNDYTTDDHANPQAHIPYAIANQQIGTVKVTSPVPVGPWRSVEASWHGFFIESFVDELAHVADSDPVAYREALLKDKPRHLAVLQEVALKAGWSTPMTAGRARGVAIFECFQSIVGEVVEIEVDPAGKLSVKGVTAVIDAGTAVNPDGLKAQVEGAIVFGLSAALYGAITIENGRVVQNNFPDYEMVRLAACPEIAVHVLNSGAAYGGGGEPGVPPLAPALANAIFAATGVRIRDLPIGAQKLRG
jgi:isoquinoline 1-oxidoreductase beta subunit